MVRCLRWRRESKRAHIIFSWSEYQTGTAKDTKYFTWNKEGWRIQNSSDLAIGHEGSTESDTTNEGSKVKGDLLDGRVLEEETKLNALLLSVKKKQKVSSMSTHRNFKQIKNWVKIFGFSECVTVDTLVIIHKWRHKFRIFDPPFVTLINHRLFNWVTQITIYLTSFMKVPLDLL